MRKIRTTAAIASAAMYLITSVGITAFAEESPATSGLCGFNLYWEYSDGTLTISGTGTSMNEHYIGNEEGCPWYPFQSEITSLVIDPECGLTRILSNTFSNYSNMTSVSLSPQIRFIDAAAIYKTNITEVNIPDTVVYISPYNFGYYTPENGKTRSDCTVYGKANSAASNYCFDTGCSFASTDGELIDVNVASDAWNFENSPKYFQATAEDLGSYLTDEHLSAFMENSTNSDYAYTKTMLNNIWSGACLGMSGLLTLSHNGVIKPSDIQAGAETINDIQMNPELESVLNYHALMLNGYAGYNLENIFAENRTDAERTQVLLEYGQKAHDDGTAFTILSRGAYGHALTGVDMISGEWEIGGTAYDRCIQMIDPNFAGQISMGSSVYIDTATGNWVQPSMNTGNTSGLIKGTVVCTSSPGILNYRGLFNGNYEYDESLEKYTQIQFLNFESFGTDLELKDQDDNVLFEWSDRTSGSRMTNQSTAYPSDNTVTLHRTVEEDSEIIATAEMQVMGYDYRYVTRGDSAEYTTISSDELSFETGDWTAKHINKAFKIEMTYNKERFDEGFLWDTIYVKTDETVSRNGRIRQCSDGYILSGDMLKNAEVVLKNIKTDNQRKTNIRTNEESVFVTYKDNTISVLADKDKDGIYETPIDAEPDNRESDMYNIVFATGILRIYAHNGAGIPLEDINTADFDTNNDGIVDITDAANVLAYYSQCGAGLTNLSFSDWMKSR